MTLRGIYEHGSVRLLDAGKGLYDGQEVSLILTPVTSNLNKDKQNDAIAELLECPIQVESYEHLSREQSHERHVFH
jgi:hypothetical protein